MPEINLAAGPPASVLPYSHYKAILKSKFFLNDSSPISPRFTYPKSEHLKSRKAIEQLFKSGESFFVYPYKVVYRFDSPEFRKSGSPEDEPENNSPNSTLLESEAKIERPSSGLRDLRSSRLLSGFAVSNRNFKHAVDRNRIKRLGREAFRLNKQLLEQRLADNQLALQVFFIFTDKKLPDWKLIEPKMQACLKKLIHLTKKHYEKLLQG